MPSGSATPGSIIMSAAPKGRDLEGYVNADLFPGIAVSLDTVDPVLGRFTYGPWVTGFHPIIILIEDQMQGKTVWDQYATGEAAKLYAILNGDELLMRTAAGSYTIGDELGLTNGTGELAAGSGPFRSLETVTLTETGLLHVYA